jgi:hypothetical protein
LDINQKIARLQSPGLFSEWNFEYIHLVDHPDIGMVGIQPHDLEIKFTEISYSNSIEQVKFFHAPEMGDWIMKKKIIIKKKSIKLFDFYVFGGLLIVSEKAKDVFDGFDEMPHQYEPVEIVDKNDLPISESPYYLLSVRRFIKITDEYNAPPVDKMIAQMAKLERAVRSALFNDARIRATVADIPIWKIPIERETAFMSLAMLEALRDAGCEGLNDYKVDNRHKGAPVSYV